MNNERRRIENIMMEEFMDHELARDIEDKIYDYTAKNIGKEDYCPHCEQESRLLKVFDCSERWWRCISCMGLIYAVAIPVNLTQVPRESRSGGVESKWFFEYAEKLKAKENKDEEKKKSGKKKNRFTGEWED
jgi:glutaredoxin